MRYLISLLLFLSFQLQAANIKVPALTSPVMDLGGFLTTEEERALSRYAYEIYANNGPQITILTVPDLQGYEIEDFSIAVAEKWQLGTKEKDNGLLVILSKAERRVRIEVGNGIEGEITDYDTAKFTRDLFPRYFKEGQFYEAFRLFMDFVADRFNIKNPEQEQRIVKRAPKRSHVPNGEYIILGIIAILVLGSTLFRKKPFARGLFTGAGFTGVSFLIGATAGVMLSVFLFGLVLGLMGVGNFLTLLLANSRGGRGGFGGGGFGGGGWSGGGGGFSGGGSSGSW